MAAIVLIAALYPFVPAPDIRPLRTAGFIGCFYADLYGFFRIAQENFQLAIAAAIIALALNPLVIAQSVYLKIMREWRMPISVQAKALYRTRAFFVKMIPMGAVNGVVNAILGMLTLLTSAVVANWLQSPLAGVAVLAIPLFVGIAVVRRMHRGTIPRWVSWISRWTLRR